MNFNFENQGANTYLVYRLNGKDQIDTLSLGMITNNKISNVAPISFVQIDNEKFFKYNVSGKISVKEFFSGPVNKKRLLGVFGSIASALLAAEEYMIDASLFLLDLEYIYVDVRTCEANLICMPVSGLGDRRHDLAAFFKNIIFSMQFDQTENCGYVTGLISYLNSSTIFSLADFKKAIQELLRAKTDSVPADEAKPPVAPVPKAVSGPAVQQQAYVQPQPAVIPQPPAAPVRQKANEDSGKQKPAGFSVPGVKDNEKAGKKQTVQMPGVTAEAEKPMSLFYLCMHYSKENKALYDAQKQNKPQQAPQKKQAAAKTAGTSFAVPGQAGAVASTEANAGQPEISVKVPVTAGGSNTQWVKAPAQSQPQAQAQTAAVPPSNTAGQLDFGDTTILSDFIAGETSVLNTAQQNTQPFMIRGKNNEKIIIDKPVFRIGKEKSYVDYFIGDNPAVSRSHANIMLKDGEYFVVDTNSKNHTYVNGTMIASNVETKISHDMSLRFANEDFTFKLY